MLEMIFSHAKGWKKWHKTILLIDLQGCVVFVMIQKIFISEKTAKS